MSAGGNCTSIDECIKLGCCWCLENNPKFKETIREMKKPPTRHGLMKARGHPLTHALVEASDRLILEWKYEEETQIETHRENCLKYLIKYGATRQLKQDYIDGMFSFLNVVMTYDYYDRILNIVLKCENEKYGKFNINQKVIIGMDKVNLLCLAIRHGRDDETIKILLNNGAKIPEEMFEKAMETVKMWMRKDDEYKAHKKHIQDLIKEYDIPEKSALDFDESEYS